MHLNSAILFSNKGEKLNGVVVVMEFTSYSSSTIGRTVFCHVFSLEEGVVEEVILHFYNSWSLFLSFSLNVHFFRYHVYHIFHKLSGTYLLHYICFIFQDFKMFHEEIITENNLNV